MVTANKFVFCLKRVQGWDCTSIPGASSAFCSKYLLSPSHADADADAVAVAVAVAVADADADAPLLSPLYLVQEPDPNQPKPEGQQMSPLEGDHLGLVNKWPPSLPAALQRWGTTQPKSPCLTALDNAGKPVYTLTYGGYQPVDDSQ